MLTAQEELQRRYDLARRAWAAMRVKGETFAGYTERTYADEYVERWFWPITETTIPAPLDADAAYVAAAAP